MRLGIIALLLSEMTLVINGSSIVDIVLVSPLQEVEGGFFNMLIRAKKFTHIPYIRPFGVYQE